MSALKNPDGDEHYIYISFLGYSIFFLTRYNGLFIFVLTDHPINYNSMNQSNVM